MKYCGQCGAKLEDDARFCGKCGALCQEQTKQPVQPQKPQKKKSPVPLIAGAAVLVAVAAAGFLGFRWYNSPEQQALRAVKAGDYAAAQEAVQGDLEAKKSEKLIGLLTQRIEELESGYEQEQMEYEAVQEELAAMEQMKISAIEDRLVEVKASVHELYRSRTYQTVYLRTSQVVTYYDGVSYVYTGTWDYDEQGRLTGYGNEYDYSDEDFDSYTSYRYTYDNDGNITGVNIDADSVITELNAIYKDGLLTEYLGTQEDEKISVQFAHDENRYPVSSITVNKDDEPIRTYEYSYDADGVMRERRFTWRRHMFVVKFNELGYATEQIRMLDDEYFGRTYNSFNEHGHLCSSTFYAGNDTDPSNILEVEYTYDDEGRVAEVYLEENGYSASGSFQGSDTYRILTLEGNSATYGDTTYVLEYDDAGNLVKESQYKNGELQTVYEYTYVALELPLDYVQPKLTNPYFYIN